MERLQTRNHASMTERMKLKITPQKLDTVPSVSHIKLRKISMPIFKHLPKKNDSVRKSINVSYMQDLVDQTQLFGLNKLESFMRNMLKKTIKGVYTDKRAELIQDLMQTEVLIEESLQEIASRLKRRERTEAHRTDESAVFKLAAHKKAWEVEKEELVKQINELKEVTQKPTYDNLFVWKIKALENELKKTKNAVPVYKPCTHKRKFAKYEMKIGELKDGIQDKDTYISNLEMKLNEFQTLFSKINDENEELKEHARIWNERWKMTNEDLFQTTIQKAVLEARIYKTRNELMKNIESEESFNDFSFVIPMQRTVERFLLARFYRRGNPEKSKDIAYVDSLKVLRYEYPAMTEFLTPLEDSAFMPPFKNWLQMYIRSIYHSKFLEHVYCKTKTRPSSFMSFVFSWMKMFHLNENGKILRSYSDSSLFRNFIVYLNVSPPSLWETHIFKQFLSDELKLDELDFFLQLRYLILKDTNLTDSVIYVSTLKVFEMIDKIMKGCPEEETDRIKKFVKAQSVNDTVDSSLALRSMLEYYRFEKTMKFKAIQELFGSSTVDFAEFYQICKSIWEDSEDSDIVELYREVWRHSKGAVSAESFFTVANENGWFFKMLIVRFGDELDFPSLSEWKSKAEERERLNGMAETMGLPKVVKEIERYEYLLNENTEKHIGEFGVWNLEEIYESYFDYTKPIQLIGSKFNS